MSRLLHSGKHIAPHRIASRRGGRRKRMCCLGLQPRRRCRAAGAGSSEVLVTRLAGPAAGAISMGACAYLSVSFRTDVDQADTARETREFAEHPTATWPKASPSSRPTLTRPARTPVTNS
jgi:hypothetical protein